MLLLVSGTIRIALLIPADERRKGALSYVVLLSQGVIALIGTEVFAGNGNLQGRIILACITLLFGYFHINVNCSVFYFTFIHPTVKLFQDETEGKGFLRCLLGFI